MPTSKEKYSGDHKRLSRVGRFERWLSKGQQKKNILLTFSYNNLPMVVRGEVERRSWNDSSWEALGLFYFCSKITLTIENKGETPVDTDSRGQPIVLDLGVRGTPNTIELVEASPENPRLILDVRDGRIVLERAKIDPGEPLNLLFLCWFAVHISEL